jgi:hypothetical protein
MRIIPITVFLLGGFIQSFFASECDTPQPEWIACEDFEQGGLGWQSWFEQSIFTECNGCNAGVNNSNRIRLTDLAEDVYTGQWALHMPADSAAGYQGASLTFRSCDGEKQAGCQLTGYEKLHFRTWLKLAPDHQYVHHFLALAGTRLNAYWESDGNAGCRPNGFRWAGTTVDFNSNHELFFYTYYPEMNCDAGGYCSDSYAQNICDGCAAKDMPCTNGLECCWGNHFGPDPAVVLPRGQWVCLEMMMQLNTPTQADGEMAFWLDRELALHQTGMHWRDVSELQLNKAWLQHYIAGGDATQSNKIWFDDVVVSTAPIGCGEPLPIDRKHLLKSTEMDIWTSVLSEKEIIFDFILQKPGPCMLYIYDLSGRIIWQNEHLNAQAGPNRVIWNPDNVHTESFVCVAVLVQGARSIQKRLPIVR